MAVDQPRVHSEAFALMWYACKCGHRERMWNSRDGVTPFGTQCPSCGKASLIHVDWNLDQRVPDHKPHKGQRFWRDGTPDEAEAIMRARIKLMVGTEYQVDDDQADALIDGARSGSNDFSEFRKGWPMLDIAVAK